MRAGNGMLSARAAGGGRAVRRHVRGLGAGQTTHGHSRQTVTELGFGGVPFSALAGKLATDPVGSK